MRLVFLGPPGAGKGTQAARLAAKLNVPAISTGDIFRQNVSEGTELGKLANSYMARGAFVPDEVTNDMVRARLAQPDCAEGFLLDGYPRTVKQVEELDGMLKWVGTSLDAVVELTADPEELVARLLKRADEQGRSDDNEETIRERQRLYLAQTAPLTEIYSRRGLLTRVDGMGDVDAVTARLYAALENRAA